jgi:heat shock protein HtpX
VTLDDARRRNRRKIWLLAVCAVLNHFVVVSALATVFGWATVSKIRGREVDVPIGPFVWAGLAAGLVIVGWRTASRIRGTARATARELGADVVVKGERPRLDNLVEELGIAAGLATPVTVAVLADPVPNALTVGAGRSSMVVLTTGLIESLTRDEIEAVLAVQICAVARLDVALQTSVVVCSSGTVAIFESFREDWKDPRSWFGILLTWPSKVAAQLLRRSAYHASDFGADDMAVSITRHPEALERALAKLHRDDRVVAAVTEANAPLWFEPVPSVGAHLRNHDDRDRAVQRYSMVPSLEDRIARLQRGDGRRRVLRAS